MEISESVGMTPDDNNEMRLDQLDAGYPEAGPTTLTLNFYRLPCVGTILPPVKITRGEEILRGMIVLGRVYRYLQAQECLGDEMKEANRNACFIIRDLYSQGRENCWIKQFSDDYVYNWGA